MAVFAPCLHRKPEVKSATQGSPPIRKRKKTSPLSIGARSTRGTTLIHSRKSRTSFRSGNGDQPSRSSRATRKWLAMLPPQGFHRPLLSIGSLHNLASSLRYLIVLIILSKYFPFVNPYFMQIRTYYFVKHIPCVFRGLCYNRSISTGDIQSLLSYLRKELEL